jgi:outer membrane lipoprotein-sorting protein
VRKLLGLAFLGLAFTGTAFADALDDIETAVAGKWDKTTSLTYDMEMTNKMAGEGFEMGGTTKGSSEMQRKDTKWNMRMDSTTESVSKMAGKDTKNITKTLMVSDGTFTYMLSDTDGQKTAMKTKAPTSESGGKAYFKTLREGNDVKTLPDETVAGQACFVIEATPKTVQPGAPRMTSRYYFAKDIGMVVQMTSKSDDGKSVTTMTLKNVKVNPSIPADHFVFTAPAGVEVQDMTDMEAKMKKMQEDAAKAAADAEAKAKEDAAKPAAKEEAKPAEKKEEPKKEEKKKPKVKGFGL